MVYKNDLVVNCIQSERAFCTAECPFNLDIKDFVGKLQQGRFNAAYKTYQSVVGFPGIVTALCEEPCKQVCPMKDSGGAISLKLLEIAAMDHARNRDPDQYNMPPKDKRVAVIGAGISGLACALRLTTRKYNVTIYEKSDRIGGHLYNLLSPEIFLDDIKRQFMHEKFSLFLNNEVTGIDDLSFDAIYVATGKEGNTFGLNQDMEKARASSRPGVFLGGSLTGVDTMHAIAQGLSVSNAIEVYFKTGQMNHPEGTIKGTKLPPGGIRMKKAKPVFPVNGTAYTKEEALAESKRCLKCTCDACVHYSPLMNYFQKFPKRITEEVEVTITPCTLDGKGTVCTRLISTCNHCGLCKEVCPKDIDTGEFLRESMQAMHKKGAMPWAFHEFYLRDMDFSNGEAALLKLPQGYDKSRYMFFPGCQLGASDPRYVTESYRFLTGLFPDTALMLSCCGAPADWAGDELLHNKTLDKIKSDWISLGNPKAIFACPMCKQMFQKFLPEIEGQFLYSIISEKGIKSINSLNEITASVFDPCASRYEPELQNTIRKLVTKAGFSLEPLPMERKMAQCCSYGGHVSIAYPPYADHMVNTRILQSDKPYITYCSNCRDIFTAADKQTWHILDIIFDLDNENRKLPTVSERRSNRLQLKHQLLNEFWREEQVMKKNERELLISQEIKEKLNDKLILESDIYSVIDNCEKSGRKLFIPESGTFTGYEQIGKMTYWVEYRIGQESGYELVNAYCHRMKIEED